MRVYGALMWNLGKVFNTPEVVRVYIGSFWDQALVHTECRELFKEEQNDLFTVRSSSIDVYIDEINGFKCISPSSCFSGSPWPSAAGSPPEIERLYQASKIRQNPSDHPLRTVKENAHVW